MRGGVDFNRHPRRRHFLHPWRRRTRHTATALRNAVRMMRAEGEL
jgi:hypothetical protein